MPIFQMLYVSGSSQPVTEAVIDDILAAARRNNARLGVTGVLLYADNTFIQVLEGEEAVVRRLADRIAQDRRHRNFMVLVEHDAPARAFADWQMGFRRLDPSRPRDGTVFAATRRALEMRIRPDDELMLDTIVAFGRDFLSA